MEEKQKITAVWLPEDLLLEILYRLPVESLMRFKCVCKSWYNHISTKDFTFLPLTDYQTSDFPMKDSANFENSISKDSMNFESSISIAQSVGDQIRRIKYPPIPKDMLRSKYSQPTVSGQCNGILCFHIDVQSDDIVLWNPVSKDLKIIPPSNLRDRQDPSTVGFGFDPETNDYKILQIVIVSNYNIGSLPQLEPALYSLRTNSWRSLDASTLISHKAHNIGYFGHPFTANRKLGWIVCDSMFPYKSKQLQLILFDVSSETFDVIPVPVNALISNVRVHLFRGSIALVNPIPPSIESIAGTGHTEIWVLDDFCSIQPRHWRKMYSVQHQVIWQKPIGFWGNRYLVFQSTESGSFMLYHLFNKDWTLE